MQNRFARSFHQQPMAADQLGVIHLPVAADSDRELAHPLNVSVFRRSLVEWLHFLDQQSRAGSQVRSAADTPVRLNTDDP